MDHIFVRGARIHNLKEIDVTIPKGSFTVITGISGSGKSSLAFDILFEEGRKRYLQSIGLPTVGERDEEAEPYREILGLPPAISVAQRTIRQTNNRSNVGTKTKILHYLKSLYALEGQTDDGVRTKLPAETFASNTPAGACQSCFGRGFRMEIDINKLIPDSSKTLENICKQFGVRLLKTLPYLPRNEYDWGSVPYNHLPAYIQEQFLNGTGNFEGLLPYIKYRTERTEYSRNWGERMYCSSVTCLDCGGYGVNALALKVKITGKHIGQMLRLTIDELYWFMQTLLSSETGIRGESKQIITTLSRQLHLLIDVGLPYLTLERSIPTLSGGELQRLFLMFHLQSQFDSLLYIFDEPTAGLHETEKHRLLQKLKSLKNAGNTVIVVEHDLNALQMADYIVELGPQAGRLGGEIIFQGKYSDFLQSENSLLRPYLSGDASLPSKEKNQFRPVTETSKKLTIKNASLYNLQDVTVEIPLGVMVGVTGPSGSGKSTLISGCLVPSLQRYFNVNPYEDEEREDNHEEIENEEPAPEKLGRIDGCEHIKKCVTVSQAPIGRSRMSTPITYVGLWDKIRNIFAELPESIALSFTPGHFSFNTESGACPECKGEGAISLDMGTLGVVNRTCTVCHGTRYKEEILTVKYNGRSIHDVLNTSVEDASQLFSENKSISTMLNTLTRVGLEYLTLGQPSPTLSGGEAQRIKLSKELGKSQKSGTLYVLDEPTTGLSYPDIEKLLMLLDELVNQGNTVVITEHDPSLLSFCDWIIEMGPSGGINGGKVVAEGTPFQLKQNQYSKIGAFLT